MSKFFFKKLVIKLVQSWLLLVQSQQWKHQNNMLNLFKFINKGTRMMSNAIYTCHQCKIESIQQKIFILTLQMIPLILRFYLHLLAK